MRYRFAVSKGKNAAGMSETHHFMRYQIIRPFLGHGGVGVELGVFMGGFGEFLMEHTSKLYLVDVWDSSLHAWTKRKADAEKAYQSILRVYRSDMERKTVEVCRETTVQFLKRQPSQSLDFIYLDAGHEYEETLAELELCLRKIKPGKFIIGDDFMFDPGVTQAVMAFTRKHKLPLIELEEWQYAIRKPIGNNWLEEYKKYRKDL